MKPSELIKITPVRNQFGKSTGQHCAEIVGTTLNAIALTREEAVASLAERLREMDRKENFTRYHKTDSGEILAIRHSFYGFRYDIVRFESGEQVVSSPSGCMFGRGTTERGAIASCEEHVRQYNESHARSVQQNHQVA